ncbi:hypothetical protein S83_069797, partial [Arachis hypogaea]
MYLVDGKDPHRIPIVDAGYTNCKGFLAPYRYYVQEWAHGRNASRNFREYFNKKHSSARNIIERCFGLLRKRWTILKSPYFYKIKTQNRIIIACCLLQNFIRLNMGSDPEKDILLEDDHVLIGEEHGGNEDGDDEIIDNVEGSNEWTAWRDNLAPEIDKWTDMSGLMKRLRHLLILWRSLSVKEESLMW